MAPAIIFDFSKWSTSLLKASMEIMKILTALHLLFLHLTFLRIFTCSNFPQGLIFSQPFQIRVPQCSSQRFNKLELEDVRKYAFVLFSYPLNSWDHCWNKSKLNAEQNRLRSWLKLAEYLISGLPSPDLYITSVQTKWNYGWDVQRVQHPAPS